MSKKEEKKEVKKRRKLKFRFKVLLLLIIVIIYSFTVSTKLIFVRDYVINTKKLSNKFHGFKIVHFSDLLYGSSIKEKELKKIVAKINDSKPDVVVFTGNLTASNKTLDKDEEKIIKKELSKINSNYGKYYVLGDLDDDDNSNLLNLSGFNNLSNNPQEIYTDNKNPILLINDHVTNYLQDYKTNAYKILVTHDPDEFDEVKNYKFNMAISGHTLNGGINIYGLKNILIDSKYTKTYQRVNDTKLFVNPGLGTKKIKMRLFNYPTINLYRFNTK